MSNIKSVPKNGIIPSLGRKTIVGIDFLDLLLSLSENATFIKEQIKFPNANNAQEFIVAIKQLFFEKYDLSLKSKFYINIDCPKNREELTLGHIGELLCLFEKPHKGELLWGYTTSNAAHYSVEMLIQTPQQ